MNRLLSSWHSVRAPTYLAQQARPKVWCGTVTGQMW